MIPLFRAAQRQRLGPSGLRWWILHGALRWTRQPHPQTSEGQDAKTKKSGEWLVK
jgi:hypothetical protein